MIWQKASLGSQFERFLATEKWLKFLKKIQIYLIP